MMERIDDYFQWNDIHWQLPKAELLTRVSDWNAALDKYCDFEGLVGLNREQVIMLHTASPFAPCANLSCEKVETKVKEFAICSRCLQVGYCSDACRRDDSTFHKKRCCKKIVG